MRPLPAGPFPRLRSAGGIPRAVRSRSRDRLQAHLAGAGVGTLVHYPVPLHRQPAFADLSPATCPCAEQLASETLSLPLYPGLSNDAIDASNRVFSS